MQAPGPTEILLFKTIFDQSPVSTQVFTPDGETIMVNKAWEELWHIPYKELKHYNILRDKQLTKLGMMSYIKRAFTGESVTLPLHKYVPSETVNTKDAVAYRWLQAKMYPIRTSGGKLSHVVLQHEDVTEKQEAEEVRNRLAAIVESSDDVIVSKTLQGIIKSWNRAAEQFFGYTADEAIGQHIYLIIPPHLRYQEDEIIRKLKNGEKIEHFETERRAKDGTLRYVSLSISPVRDSSGTIVGASKIARNIEERKKADAALAESEERLRLALQAGKIGVWDWDISHNDLTWTENVYYIHGVTPEKFKLSFENFQKLVHPDDVERVSKALEQTLQNRQPFSIEFRIVTPDGETRWVATSATASFNADGRPERLLGATTDITSQKQLEQDKSDFLSMASHELKTPLTSMKIFIDLLNSQLSEIQTGKAGYYLTRIHDQANRLTELTNDLLDVSRIETGKLKLSLESFELRELVMDTIESLQPSTNTHEIILEDKTSAIVTADRYRLYQVLVNLLTNAIKYSGKGKKIIVRIDKDDKEAIVSVQDFGIGIKKSQLQKIFERLYQVNDPTEKTYPGLGLGLYISKEIIERHNGSIWVESKKGVGSTFFFRVPLTSAAKK